MEWWGTGRVWLKNGDSVGGISAQVLTGMDPALLNFWPPHLSALGKRRAPSSLQANEGAKGLTEKCQSRYIGQFCWLLFIIG